jgi:predicted metal-dependent hydrolase
VVNLAQKSVQLGARRVEFTVRVSRGAKRRRISVTPSGVEVTLPGGHNGELAEAFLRENATWVLSQIDFVERSGSFRKPLVPASPVVLLRGQEISVDVVPEDSARWYGRITTNGRLSVRVPTGNTVDPVKTLEGWFRRQARADIMTRLAERSREMRVEYGRLYLMGQRTKWGGCSGRKNLSFNWRLVMAPPDVLDYVVVHELAHLIEPSHSSKFWLLVRSYCPDFERHRTWLRVDEWRLRLPASLEVGTQNLPGS